MLGTLIVGLTNLYSVWLNRRDPPTQSFLTPEYLTPHNWTLLIDGYLNRFMHVIGLLAILLHRVLARPSACCYRSINSSRVLVYRLVLQLPVAYYLFLCISSPRLKHESPQFRPSHDNNNWPGRLTDNVVRAESEGPGLSSPPIRTCNQTAAPRGTCPAPFPFFFFWADLTETKQMAIGWVQTGPPRNENVLTPLFCSFLFRRVANHFLSNAIMLPLRSIDI